MAHPSSGLWDVPLPAGTAVATAAGRLSADFATGLSPRSGPGYVLYVSRRAGRPGIWQLANSASRELWVGSPSDVLSAPAIAPDGRRIAFTVADGERARLYVMQSDGAHPSRRVVFTHEPNTILVLRGEFAHKDLWLIDLKTGAERPLTRFAADFDIRDFDISADKSEILFDRVEETSTVALVDRAG